MFDMPSALGDNVNLAFVDGAAKAISRAHFRSFLVKGRKVVFETEIDVSWRFDQPGAGGPGVYEGGRSHAVDSLPPVLAHRLHEQYPTAKDIK